MPTAGDRHREQWRQEAPVLGFDPATLSVRHEFTQGTAKVLKRFQAGDIPFEVRQGKQTLWLQAHWPKGGSLALRTAYVPEGEYAIDDAGEEGCSIEYALSAPFGRYRVRVRHFGAEAAMVRWTVLLTPDADLLVSEWPHDIYALDEKGDPMPTRGIIHAAQRGSAAGVMYFSQTEPESGTALYLQNLTALNDYCRLTGTVPNTIVGDSWPHMGNVPPRSRERPLPRGREVCLCDAFLRMEPEVPENERQSAALFLKLLADIYPHLEQPDTAYRDWPARAERTIRDLERSPKCRIPDQDFLYLRPYTAAESPDSMCQLTVLLAIRDYARWKGEDIPLAAELRKGVPDFFDHRLGAMRRYLPSVGGDKDSEEVDSWYQYHPLTNLARLAQEGDEDSRELLLGSLDYAVRVAQRFQYEWPVQFNLETLQVKKRFRKPGEGGQTDVGGLYAYVMLQALDITQDKRYLEEARRAVDALVGLRFSIGYQLNNTAWGAIACLRLWRITGEQRYLEQSHVFLASFFHNTFLWESELGAAENYPTFLGVSCLHDGNYMAPYEEYEAFAAFHEYLSICGDEVPDWLELLLAEYCRHMLSRAWYYYPEELPGEALAPEVRNGHIDRCLSVPLEDLYVDGEPAGAVGQEIYGAGVPFALAVRSWHRVDGAPLQLYCDYPLHGFEVGGDRSVCFEVRGRLKARLRVMGQTDECLEELTVETRCSRGKRSPKPTETGDGYRDYSVQGGSTVTLRW